MSQQISSIIARYSNELVGRLRFVPLGLLWGLVAGSISTYLYISFRNGPFRFDVDVILDWSRVEPIFVPIIGAVAGSFLIATLLGSALLTRKSSSFRWLVDWVITGAGSCAGGAAVFVLILHVRWTVGLVEWLQTEYSYESPFILFGAGLVSILPGVMFALACAVPMGIVSAMVALPLAPIALLGRRLILRRASTAEPAGDASQDQP